MPDWLWQAAAVLARQHGVLRRGASAAAGLRGSCPRVDGGGPGNGGSFPTGSLRWDAERRAPVSFPVRGGLGPRGATKFFPRDHSTTYALHLCAGGDCATHWSGRSASRAVPATTPGSRDAARTDCRAGLRISEALDLRLHGGPPDSVLQIRRTKFGKSRMVRLHLTVTSALARYLTQRRRLIVTDDHIFTITAQ